MAQAALSRFNLRWAALIATLAAVYLVFAYFDAFEQLSLQLQQLEPWEVDEICLVLMLSGALTLIFIGFAASRGLESRREFIRQLSTHKVQEGSAAVFILEMDGVVDRETLQQGAEKLESLLGQEGQLTFFCVR